MPDIALSCYRCGRALRLVAREKIQRRTTCAGCGSELHSCVHCRFFDPSRSSECTETQAEWVRDKEAANFCDYFEPRTSVDFSARRGNMRQADARAAFQALFRD